MIIAVYQGLKIVDLSSLLDHLRLQPLCTETLHNMLLAVLVYF